jgi:hypothetical protein
LNEVVVVGYGTQRKAEVTGAVAQISGDVLDNRAIPNVSQGLQGEVAGLNLIMFDGKPHSRLHSSISVVRLPSAQVVVRHWC